MVTAYREAGRDVSEGAHRLLAVMHLRERESYEETAEEVAAHYGLSRARLYELANRAESLLEPQRPGPKPGARTVVSLEVVIRAQAEVIALRDAEIARLEAELADAVRVGSRRRDQLNLVCAGRGVSLRGTQEIFEVAWGSSHTPPLEDLQRRRRHHGEQARAVLERVEREVGPSLEYVAADEIYLHGHPVNVVVEPRSVAILGIARWESTTGEDWHLWLTPYPALKLLISDLGAGLVAGAEKAGVPHQADYFHEKRWWDKHLLTPLAKVADRAWEVRLYAWEGATRVEGPGRRISARSVAEAEAASDSADAEFFEACAILDVVDTLFQATDPATRGLWTREGEARVGASVLVRLGALTHAVARRAARHFKRYSHRYSAWHQMFDAIPVQLRCTPANPDAAQAKRREVIADLLQVWDLERSLQGEELTRPEITVDDLDRRIRRLEHRLHRHCANLPEVIVSLRRLLKYPPRSSSAVESINSLLRTLQTTHRNVTDEMLALKALSWNLTRRRYANRRGHRSPYEMLGVRLGRPEQRWYDILFDEEAKAAA